MCENNDDKLGLQYLSSHSTSQDKYTQPGTDFEPLADRSVIRRPVAISGRETRSSRHSFSNSPPYQGNESHAPLGSKLIKSPQETSHGYELEHSYSNDVTASTYALQVALKNMKERYQKLQKKILVLEEENGRLINGKTELFGEIGKMQESSIKLREKNLQLNHEVHNKHQECCSLKEQFANLSEENIKLSTQLLQTSNEKKKLVKQVEELDNENCNLRKGIRDVLQCCSNISGVNAEFLQRLENLAYGPKYKFNNKFGISPKTKIVPLQNDLASNFDIHHNINIADDDFSFIESHLLDQSKDFESLSIDAFVKARESTKKMAALLQKQREQLLDLAPIFEKISKGGNLDSSEKNNSTNNDVNYASRLATCNSSTLNALTLNISEDAVGISPPINDSGGETNVLVEEKIESGNRSPFDWRKVEVSDDDTNECFRPEMRTVSTSPDMTLMTSFDLEAHMKQGRSNSMEKDDRTCPMCNAIFPMLLPQETFESHVVSHFEVENGYEVVT